MKFKRIGRVLVCLLLVSALLINASPIKAKATGVGAAAVITSAATVTVSAPMVIGATFIALGLAAAANPEGFQNMVDAGVSALESAGTWIKDGMVELLRTEDADGNASYYVDSGLIEDVHSHVFDTGVVTDFSGAFTTSKYIDGYTYRSSKPFYVFSFSYKQSGYAQTYYTVTLGASGTSVQLISASGSVAGTRTCNDKISDDLYYTASGSTYQTSYNYLGHFTSSTYASHVNAIKALASKLALSFHTSEDIALGVLPAIGSDLTDGTSARQWSEEYTDRGLKVYGGGSGNNNNDGKWFWPVVLVAGADLWAMSQADAWASNTPPEFDDYETKEELKVMDTPEVEFGFGIVLEPDSGDSSGSDDPTESTQPTTPGGLPDIGGGDNPDTGGDGNTGTESGNQTDYTNWFERIIKGIEELPSKFENWITDCKTAIEELPSKFAEWFNNINSKLERLGERLQTIGESIVNGVSTLGEKIVSLGQIIVEGVQNAISSLFTPSPDYFTNKVEALKAKHHNIDKFNQLGNDFKLFFTGLGSKPPIIWIDLGAATGAYLWGGRQIFLDLTWYADYKPKMDAILGAIIWLWLAWRVFLSVPGIINGASGVWGKYHRGGSRDDN